MEEKSAIARYRAARGLTLEQFGKLFEPPVDKSTVSRWQRGQLSPKRALLIERRTGIPRAELLPAFFATEAAE